LKKFIDDDLKNKEEIEIPDSIEELNKYLNKNLQILESYEIPTVLSVHPPYLRRVKCPYCSTTFNQKVSGGEFPTTYPNNCPSCGYPRSFDDKYWKLKKEKEK
jgi:DNA-directed RNA polymerase subunit RPC12/RpoP